MIHRSYFKHTREAHFDVAHLYEHAFVEMFYERLPWATLGAFINGETFYKGGIFLMATFSHEKYARLFDKYVHDNPLPSEADIRVALRQLETEEGGFYKIKNKSELQGQLVSLSDRPWEVTANLPVIDNRRPGKRRASPFIFCEEDENNFRVATVTFSLVHESTEDAAVFGRLLGVMLETVGRSLYTELGVRWKAAEAFGSTEATLHEKLYITSITKIPMKALKKVIAEALAELAKPENYPYIKDYFSAWKYAPYMSYLTPGLYSDSAIIISSGEAYRLLDPERVKRVISNTRVTASSSRLE